MATAVGSDPTVLLLPEALPWLLQLAPITLSYCYQSVAINLHFVCDIIVVYHVQPHDAYLRITTVCFNSLLHNFYPLNVWRNAEVVVIEYMPIRCDSRISLCWAPAYCIRCLLFYS